MESFLIINNYFIVIINAYCNYIIIIIIYLSWSWATCWPIPVSRIQKSLQRSTMIPSTSWGSSISLPWVIYFEAFYLHVVSSFPCIPVICPKLVFSLTPLQFVHLTTNVKQFIYLPSMHKGWDSTQVIGTNKEARKICHLKTDIQPTPSTFT